MNHIVTPRGPPLPSVTPESPSRNENSGEFVQTAFNSPPSSNYLPESPAHLPGVSTTTAITSPVAVDAAALAAAPGVPPPFGPTHPVL